MCYTNKPQLESGIEFAVTLAKNNNCIYIDHDCKLNDMNMVNNEKTLL